MPTKSNCGVVIEDVHKGSIAEKAGLLPGDRLVKVNGHEIRDIIDLMFFGHEPDLKFLVRRKDRNVVVGAGADVGGSAGLGIMLKPPRIRTCGNNCVFCFVSQLPRGLRRSLYVRDEDYRMSFLYGNYITMTNLTDADKKRIVAQRLSPLYISVHSTDTEVRNRMIGRQSANNILDGLRFLAANRIRMHVQIVLCPGYNDGRDLEKTIADLYRFYPYVMSIAVVPVGLTGHRKKALKPVGREDALRALGVIGKFQARFKKKHGEHIVYAADELYIKAGVPVPALEHYGDLPQIENGVGLVPLFIQQARRVKIPEQAQGRKSRKHRFITFTGVSFYPYLAKFIERLRKNGVDIEAVPVENTFFGKSITVTGLLTGRDVLKSLSGVVKEDDVLLIPDIVMKEGDEVFLDDVSKKDVEDILGVRAVVIESTPKGIVDAIVL